MEETLTEPLKIQDNEGAFLFLKRQLWKRGWEMVRERKENKARDLFLVVQRGRKVARLYCKFRREFFLTYAMQFAGEKGYGESVNKQHLERAFALRTDRLVFVYQNTAIKWCYPAQFKAYAESHETIRRQKKANRYGEKQLPIFEITYSVPISLLNNL